MSLCEVKFEDWNESLFKLMKLSSFNKYFKMSGRKRILIKPNLVNEQPPPITTHVELCGAIIDFIRTICSDVEIIIGEGVGVKTYTTMEVFNRLGYTKLAREKGIKLIDLNQEKKLVYMQKSDCKRWPEMWLPEIVMNSFLLSVPVLKAHSLAGVTLTMKNMLGIAPPKYFDAGSWKKSAFHTSIHEAIFELNLYRSPDFTVMDAVEGMAEAHLWGAKCNPPPNLLAASFDPVAIDVWGCKVLGVNWENIQYIKMANGILGTVKPSSI